MKVTAPAEKPTFDNAKTTKKHKSERIVVTRLAADAAPNAGKDLAAVIRAPEISGPCSSAGEPGAATEQ